MMPTNETDWVATETEWGDAACEEIKNAFPGKLKSREVALCVWCYGRQPDITQNEIEEIAQRDPVIMELRRQKKISAHGQRRAKSLLGLDTNPEDDLDPNLTSFEREVLLDLRATAALLDAYTKTEARMRKAEAAFEVARAKLLEVTPESARNLAEYEPRTRPMLAAEGLLSSETPGSTYVESVTSPPTPPARPAESSPAIDSTEPSQTAETGTDPQRTPTPAPTTRTSDAGETVNPDPQDTSAADFAIDKLLKKKVRVAPKTSMIDDVSAPFDLDDDVLDEDFHATMDDCTNDAVVYWPEDRESLSD